MDTAKLQPNLTSQKQQHANPDDTTRDKVKLPPPKNFEKYEKILLTMMEENMGRTRITKEDIPKEALEYLQRIYDPKFQPDNFENWSIADQEAWIDEYGFRYFQGMPESLKLFVAAFCRPGDNQRPLAALPEWLDVEKFRRGQKFARDNFFGLSFNMMLSFFAVYTFKDGIQPVIITKKSSTPYAAFNRYLRNMQATWVWYTSIPWEKGTEGYKMLEATRKMHQATMNMVRRKTPKEMDEATKIKGPWCPMRKMMLEEFRTVCPRQNILERPYLLYEGIDSRPKNFNQADMAMTMFGFVGFPLICPEFLGIRNAKEEDLEAYCHLWKTMGYLLGIEDEFNLCTGSVEEIRQRSKDLVEYWMRPNMTELEPEWEHLTRCMAEGVGYFILYAPYMAMLYLLTVAINMSTPRLYAALDWTSWMFYKFYMFYINYLVKIPGMVSLFNKITVRLMLSALAASPQRLRKYKEKSEKTISSNSIVI